MQLLNALKRLSVMKLYVLFIIAICLSSLTVNGQNTETNKKRIELIEVEQENIEKTIAALKFNIEQIEEKIKQIKNNQDLLAEAESSGYLIELKRRLLRN